MTRNKNTQDLLCFKAIINFNKYNIKLNVADKEDKLNEKEVNKIKQEIDKLNRKKIDATELFYIDEIDYETFKDIKEVVDSKISVISKELELIDNKDEEIIETNEDVIKEIIVNLKRNFIKLNNHKNKMFLERFVKEIRVKKEGDEVMIESVLF